MWTPRSEYWWSGSPCLRRTGVHPFVALWPESRTSAPANSGTRSISSQKSFLELLVNTRNNRSPLAAPTTVSSGMTRFSIHNARGGGRLPRLLSGMARSSASVRPWSRHSRIVLDALPSGLGVADSTAVPSLLFQFHHVDDLPTHKNRLRAGCVGRSHFDVRFCNVRLSALES
jgi:hypothetical protein